MPSLALAHLLRAAVMKTNLRHRIHDLFSVQLENHAQHAVSAWMLWPNVQEQDFAIGRAAPHTPFLGTEPQRLLLRELLLVRELEFAHLRCARRVILTQRVACPSTRHEDTDQVRMSGEADAEHIPHFALVPVRRRPQMGHSVGRKSILLERSLYAEVLVAIV